MTAMAFGVDRISETVIEAVNQIGSAFYGPILAAFLLGLWCPLITSPGVWAGVVGSVALNVTLWVGFPGIHWMWWNVFGTGCTAAVALAVSLIVRPTLSVSGPRYSRELQPALLGLAACAAAVFTGLATLTGAS